MCEGGGGAERASSVREGEESVVPVRAERAGSLAAAGGWGSARACDCGERGGAGSLWSVSDPSRPLGVGGALAGWCARVCWGVGREGGLPRVASERGGEGV